MTIEDHISYLETIGCDGWTVTTEAYMSLQFAIEALEQEAKTGHWEWVPYDSNPNIGNWHCSKCRCVVVECVDKNDKGGIPWYKYCPQCGIKMESEEKDA